MKSFKIGAFLRSWVIVGHLGRLLESLALPVSVEKLVIQMSDDLKSLIQLKLILGKIGQEMLTMRCLKKIITCKYFKVFSCHQTAEAPLGA